MSAGERGSPTAGPFVNLSQVYCNGLDVLAKSSEPLVKGVGRVNLEVLGLMTRRTRAWLELPARLSQCKSPQDLQVEQLRFWQNAALDYTEGVQRLATAFSALAPAGLNGAWSVKATPPSRDYISVHEARQVAEEAPRRERRAA
jgi:hypothetical protein